MIPKSQDNTLCDKTLQYNYYLHLSGFTTCAYLRAHVPHAKNASERGEDDEILLYHNLM